MSVGIEPGLIPNDGNLTHPKKGYATKSISSTRITFLPA